MFAMKFLINKTPLLFYRSQVILQYRLHYVNIMIKNKRKIDNANTHVGWS